MMREKEGGEGIGYVSTKICETFVLHEATSWGIQENDTVYIHTHTHTSITNPILSFPSPHHPPGIRNTAFPLRQLKRTQGREGNGVGSRAKGRWDRIGCVTEVGV
jgi:hypothetical protein